MWSSIYKLIVLLYVVCLLSGCIGGGAATPVRYYLVDPAEYPSASLKVVRQLNLEIINLHIPQYLGTNYFVF